MQWGFFFTVFLRTAVRPTLLRQVGMWSLACAQMWLRACNTHKRESDTSKSARGMARMDTKLSLTLMPRQGGMESRVFGFEFRRSIYWASSVRPMSIRVTSIQSHTLLPFVDPSFQLSSRCQQKLMYKSVLKAARANANLHTQLHPSRNRSRTWQAASAPRH